MAIGKLLVSSCKSNTRSKKHQGHSLSSSTPLRLVDLLSEMSALKDIKEQTKDFISQWYTTNCEATANASGIDKIVKNHVVMKAFSDYASSEATNNPDNSYIGALRFLSFIYMTGLDQNSSSEFDNDGKYVWYLKAAVNFLAKCFFGDDEESEVNAVPLKNAVLRQEIENINQILLKDIDIKTILPLIFQDHS